MKKKLLSALIANMVIPAVIIGAAPNVLTAPPKSADAAVNYENKELARYAYQVAAIVNRERAANGIAPLKFSEELSNAAIARAQELKTSFSHKRPNGSLCFTVLDEMGISYSIAAENIAYGQRSPEEAVSDWMSSEGHRGNILSADFDYIGIGVAYKNGIYYWTQMFASSSRLTGDVITEGSLLYISKTSDFGDTNGDGAVDAADASNILALYAKLSTSNVAPMAHELSVFDINKDGAVDSTDAATVLSYYAYISTGNGALNLEEFMKR